MLRRYYSLLTYSFFSLPLLAYAAVPGANTAASSVVTSTLAIAKTVIILMMVFAFIVLGWGIIKLISASGDPTAVAKAKGVLWWGVIGIAVFASLLGFVSFIQSYFGLEQGNVVAPRVNEPAPPTPPT